MKEIIFGKIIALIYWIYASTFRFKIHYHHPSAEIGYQKLRSKQVIVGNSVIVGLYHQDELAALTHFAHRKTVVMVSDSKDGSIFASALRLLGYKTVRGSSSRGGVKAFIAALKKIREGYSCAIAVDGPRGPIYEVKEGVIKLCEKSDVEILPMRLVPRHCFTAKKAWAKSRLPYPFSIVDVHVGNFKTYSSADSLKSELDSLERR